jgi:hypothetical protein
MDVLQDVRGEKNTIYQIDTTNAKDQRKEILGY